MLTASNEQQMTTLNYIDGKGRSQLNERTSEKELLKSSGKNENQTEHLSHYCLNGNLGKM